MSGALDLLIVLFVIAAAALFAFLSLAPRPWRARLLRLLAAAAGGLSLQAAARRLGDAAARSAAAGGCGGCGDCDAGKPPAAGPQATDVRVPLSSLKRRR